MQKLRKNSPRAMTAWTALLTLAVGAVTATGAQAACTYPPDTLVIPEGKSATEEDMLAAADKVKKYLAAMESYIGCLNAEEAALPPEQQTEEAKALAAKRHDAAVVAMEGAAARFNEQVRAFKAKP